MKTVIPRILAAVLALCLCVGPALAQEEKTPVTMYLSCGVVEFPPDGNEIETIIEEYTGVDMKITAYSGTVLHEMLPTLIAGDDLPMVVNFGGSQLSRSYMISAMQSGVFWDVTDAIHTLDNFKDLHPIALANYAIDGRLYGLPLERGLARDAVTYRYDWLENLGMKEPETVDEVIEMLKAFTLNDPDGNGVQDTYGSCTNPLYPIAIFLGAPNNWAQQDGEMIKSELTEEYQAALDIVRELYSIGAIHPEYAIRVRADYEGDFREGKAGVYFNVNTDISAFQSIMVQPQAVLHSRGVFQNAAGQTHTSAGRGHNGLVVISTSAVREEALYSKIINLFDRLADEEMCNLLALGQEGVHYEVVDGVAHMIEEADASYIERIYNPYTTPLAIRWPNLRTMPVDYNYGDQRTLDIIQENEPYAVSDPTLGLISELYNDIGGDLNTLIEDAKTLYIMGEIDKAEFQSRLNQWRSQGGDDLAKDFARLYAEKNQ